jgi:hypothetical protein
VLGWWVVVKKGEFAVGGRLTFQTINPQFLLKCDE